MNYEQWAELDPYHDCSVDVGGPAGLVTVQTSSMSAYLSKHRMWRKGPLGHIEALITHQDYNMYETHYVLTI